MDIQLNEAWSSKASKDHRDKIRQELSRVTGFDLSDLRVLPDTDLDCISISHCPQVGGYAFVKKPTHIGFDLEVSSRVQEKVVARISTQAELSEAPSFAHLWSAKEATFKSLKFSDQPATLSSIVIEGWQRVPPGIISPDYGQSPTIWAFQARFATGPQVPGNGAVLDISGLFISIFTLQRST